MQRDVAFWNRKDEGSMTMLGDKRKPSGIWYILNQVVDKDGPLEVGPLHS